MSKKGNIVLILALLGSVILAACQPAVVATETQVATEEVVATEPPLTDTELNVLCTPQERVVPGNEAGI